MVPELSIKHMSLKPIAILGAGAWGTALGIHLARLGQTVWLWGSDASKMHAMQQNRANTAYLPEALFPDTLQCTADLTIALSPIIQDVLIAVPSHVCPKLLQHIQPYFHDNRRLILASKGFDPDSQELLYNTVELILGSIDYAILSGPSFAKEVAEDLPTAITIASRCPIFAAYLQQRFHTLKFRVYTASDVIGVSLGGAMKNVLAIAVGIADGLGLGANARAALIARGLAEMVRLGKILGAKLESFMGLSGIGDLVLTCSDNQSRNRRLGLLLGQGQSVDTAKQNLGQLAEGFASSYSLYHRAQKEAVDLPICESIYNILHKGAPLTATVETLLNRTPTIE